jgi:hypothetical protein
MPPELLGAPQGLPKEALRQAVFGQLAARGAQMAKALRGGVDRAEDGPSLISVSICFISGSAFPESQPAPGRLPVVSQFDSAATPPTPR